MHRIYLLYLMECFKYAKPPTTGNYASAEPEVRGRASSSDCRLAPTSAGPTSAAVPAAPVAQSLRQVPCEPHRARASAAWAESSKLLPTSAQFSCKANYPPSFGLAQAGDGSSLSQPSCDSSAYESVHQMPLTDWLEPVCY